MLKRIGRYLVGASRPTYEFAWQKESATLDAEAVASHSGWKGASAAMFFVGTHLIGEFSRTQGVTSLSSGESEYHALVEAAKEMLFPKAM